MEHDQGAYGQTTQGLARKTTLDVVPQFAGYIVNLPVLLPVLTGRSLFHRGVLPVHTAVGATGGDRSSRTSWNLLTFWPFAPFQHR